MTVIPFAPFLKPCPFCGVRLLNMKTDEGAFLCVHPIARGCIEKHCVLEGLQINEFEIRAWNRRTP